MSNTSIYLQPVMPAQKLAQREKGEEWGKQCIDAIIGMGNQTSYNGRTSRYKKQVNYDLVNSIFNEEDFEYVINPYGVTTKVGETPSRLQDFNIIRSKLELLKGEEIKRPFNYMAVGTGGEILNIMQEKKKDIVINYIQSLVLEDNSLQKDEQGNPILLEKLLRKFDTNYRDIREQCANQILQYLEKKENLLVKFNKGWEHALIAAEEIYYIGIVADEPVCRVVNPLYFDYDRNPGLDCIEDAQWAKEDRYLSVGQILDEFGEFLSEDDVEKLDKGLGLGMNAGRNTMYPGFAYDPNVFDSNRSNDFHQTSHISVTTTVWKSMTKLGFLKYTDEKGKQQETIVDDNFKLDPEMKAAGWILEHQWIPEIYKGTKIGSDIYIDIAPLPNQCRSMDNPASCKLPYVGRIYNSLNSKSTSLVELAKPHQYAYIIVWYRLMNELAKAKGKKMVFDMAQLPKSQGMDMDKWMYYFDNLGIAFINSFEEGTEGSNTGKTSNFNQFTAIDMALSQIVQQYMMIIEKLEGMVGDICGVTKQREGQIATSETVGGVERSVVQSSMITEPLFYLHGEVKKQVLTQLVETAKIAYMNGKKAQFVLDEGVRVFLEVDGEIFNDSEYGVFISDSSRDLRIKEKLEQLAQVAIQNDKAQLSDIIKVIKSNSISEIENTIVKSEQEAIQRTQQSEQGQQDGAMQQQQMMNDNAEAERNFKAEQNQLDRDNKLQIAEISAMSFNEDKDVDKDGVLDVLEIEKLRSKERETLIKDNLERDKMKLDKTKEDNKIQHEKEMQKNELKVEQEKIAAQKIIAKSKPRPKK